MSVKIAETPENEEFLRVVSGFDQSGGEPRMKEIVHRIVRDLFKTIDALDITPDEFWTAVSYINDLGALSEAGLLAPGLGLGHFLDLRMDAEDKQRGVRTGTPRTIEGPLYVAGAPLSKGEARLDDGTEQGETLVAREQIAFGGAVHDGTEVSRHRARRRFDNLHRHQPILLLMSRFGAIESADKELTRAVGDDWLRRRHRKIDPGARTALA